MAGASVRHAALWIGVILVSAVGALDVPLTYQPGLQENLFYLCGRQEVALTRGAPEGPWKLPAFKNAAPWHGLVSLGGRQLLIVLDAGEDDDLDSAPVFFDANGNGDLTDDAVLLPGKDARTLGDIIKELNAVHGELAQLARLEDSQEGAKARERLDALRVELEKLTAETKRAGLDEFSLGMLTRGGSRAIEATIPLEGGATLSHRFRFDTYLDDDRDPFVLDEEPDDAPRSAAGKAHLVLDPDCSYVGRFTHAGVAYRVVLLDRNANGLFDDRASMPAAGAEGEEAMGDFLAVTDAEDVAYRDVGRLGGLLGLGSDMFRVKIDMAACMLRLDPVKDDGVPVALAAKVDRLQLIARSADHTAWLVNPGERVMLPPDDYRLSEYHITRKDDQGDTWQLSAGGGPATAVISVRRGEEASCGFGEPFSAKVTAVERTRRVGGLLGLFGSRTVSSWQLEFSLEGSAREVVSGVLHVDGDKTTLPRDRSGRRPRPPTYKIIASDGKLAAQGAFEYG